MRFFLGIIILVSNSFAFPLYTKNQTVKVNSSYCKALSNAPVSYVKTTDFRFIRSKSAKVFVDTGWLLKSVKKSKRYSKKKIKSLKEYARKAKVVCSVYKKDLLMPTPTPTSNYPTPGVQPTETPTISPTPTVTSTPTNTPTPTATPAWKTGSTYSMKTHWKLGQAITIYAHSPGGNAGINLSAMLTYAGPEDQLVVRVFNPNRELETSERFLVNNTSIVPIENNLDLSFIPLRQQGVWAIRINSRLKNLRLNMIKTEGIELSVSYGNGKFEPWTENGSALTETYIPISQHPGINSEISIQSSEGNILSVSKVECANNNLLTSAVSLNTNSTSSTIRLLKGSGNGVLKVVTQSSAKLSVIGTPSIFSASCEEASRVGTRRIRIQSGPYAGMIVYHKFQQDISSLATQISPYLGNTNEIMSRISLNDSVKSSACKSPSADIDVYKNFSLIYPYDGTILAAYWALLTDPETGIPNQILNTTSHFFGAIGASQFKKQLCTSDYDLVNRDATCVGGKSDRNFDPLKDRWDSYRSVTYESTGEKGRDSMYAGLTPNSTFAYALGFAATTRTSCNPFSPNADGTLAFPELAARSVLASLVELLALPEHGIWLGIDADNTTYEGIPAFTTFKHFSNFRTMSPYLEQVFGVALGQEIRRVWGDGLRHIVDRVYTDDIVNYRNQSSHYLLGFNEFAEGAKLLPYGQRYKEWANEWAGNFFNSQDPTGYYTENFGPDAQYIGMTASMIARYYNHTKRTVPDSRALDSLEQVYGFFGHTSAPDGNMVGGSSNFAHRVAWSFPEKYWGWDDTLRAELPVIASYPLKNRLPITQIRTALNSIATTFATRAATAHKVNRLVIAATFDDLESNDLSTTNLLPAKSESNFARVFGDELFSVKRPGYFATINFGVSKSDGVTIPAEARSPLALENQAPTTWTPVSPSDDPNNVKLIPAITNNGGGISVFNTASFGSAILSQAWSPLTSNGLIAVVSGQRYWPNYNSITHSEVLTGIPQLTVNGTISEAGIQYSRTYRFFDSYIEVSISASKILGSLQTPSSLVENLPLLTCTRAECGSDANIKRKGARLYRIDGAPLVSGASVNGIQVRDLENNRVRFDFLSASPTVTVMEHGLRYNYWNQIEYQVGSAQINLPIPSSSVTTFVYRIYPN